ncbi:MAG: exosortase-associated EpsI family protein [Kiritimatiellia bacterium]|jgi:hypothetical protein|nr:exosortase-associated EpsI family protein [Kiritimatiellia bacterium]MDP6811173.1 exosortase-associated EpsI family protein [Kiritimatiellia bacterium]MDP7025270.1 exosortase-associated EpsI family protein [Kiritimatiellia bacterium]
MDKHTFTAHLAIIGMLGVAAVALKFGVDVTLEDRPGVYMRMPAQVLDWTGRKLLYCHNEDCSWSGVENESADDLCPQCQAEVYTMAWVEKDQLPADTEFLKYRYTRPTGEILMASIVLSGNERSSIHRPQRCLVAQGFDITRSVVDSVDLPERGRLDVMMLDTLFHHRGQQTGNHARPVFYAYWFVGQNRETPSHLMRMFWLAWDRVFHGVAHRWVYIMIQGHGYRSREAFAEALGEFLPTWYPAIVR